MRLKYTLIYQVQGLIISNVKSDVILLEDSTHSFKAFLSNDLDNYCVDIDRRTVIGKKILSGLGEQTFESHLEETRKQRNERYQTPPFLIIEIIGEDSSFMLMDAADKGDYILCIQNDTGDFSKAKYQNLINGVVSSLCITIDTFYKVKKVGDAVVYYNEAGKPIYNMLFSFNGTGFSSREILDADIEATKKCSSALSNNETLSTVCRLLVQSVDSKNDALLSYLSAWTALEVFVHKTFKIKKQMLITSLTERGLDESFRDEIEKDKFTLMNKFRMMCLYLNNQDECSDVESFRELKDTRDKLLHGDEIDLKSLPIFDTQNLLRKYLSTYIFKSITVDFEVN